MLRWLNRAQRLRLHIHEVTGKKQFDRFSIESLEKRTLLAAAVGAPTLLDPVAPLRVDQGSYAIRGVLQAAAKNNTTVSAYRDTNQNGIYNAGVDSLVASVVVPKKSASFAVAVPLIQDTNNQFFVLANDGGKISAPVKVPLIAEDSTAPTVKEIKRIGAALTNAGSVQFQVNFSEPVVGVGANDFQVVRSGSLTSGAVSVSGTGSSYTVTVDNLSGDGTLAMNLIDDDTIGDIM